MLDNYIYDRVCDYIDNEINFIKNQIEIEGYQKSYLEDLNKLENMTSEEKNKIAMAIIDSYEVEKAINEITHYYLYEKAANYAENNLIGDELSYYYQITD